MKPLIAIPLGDLKVRGVFWAGDNRVLVQKSDTAALGLGFTADKAELSSMIVLPLDGGKMYQVFQGNAQITGGISGFHGVVERAGKYYGYFGGMTMDGRDGMFASRELKTTKPVLYEVDLETGRATKLADRADEQSWRDWLIGADGSVKATLNFAFNNGRWSIRNAKGDKIAEGVNPLGGVALIGFGSQPDTLIYGIEDETGGGGMDWTEVPLAGGSGKPILDDVGVRQSFFHNRTRTFLGYEVEGDKPTYRFFDPQHQKLVNGTLKAFPGSSVHLVEWSDDFGKLVVMTEGPGDPQRWWLVDVKARTAEPLGTAYPIVAEAVGPMRMVKYQAADGMDIEGVLTLPPGREAKALPVVVLPHGGPSARDYPGFDWWAQAFASRGYAVLQPNFRGSTGYGPGFERAGRGEWGRKMQTDMSDGLAHLVREGIVDPKRACIMGASYGGYAALAGVTLQQGLYRCAVSVAGVSDVAKLVITEINQSGENQTLARGLKAEIGSGRDLRAVSPINFAAKADAPVLLIHGKDDIVVLYDQSNDMAAALRRANKPVEMVTLAGEDHWLSRGETRLAMLKAAVDFVEKHNPPDPAR
ncbi:MAG: S9 family peptidase [Sphingobium sp.]